MRLRWFGLACALAVVPSIAAAHGRPPYVERVAFDPSDPDRVVLQFSFGLAVTEDAGASWRWVCAAAYGADASWEEPDVVVTGDGTAVLGTFETGVRAARDLCSFERPGGSIADTAVIDLAIEPDARTVWAITSRGGGELDRVQRSDGGGASWSVVAELEGIAQTIAIAPSDPARVYVTAMIPATESAPRRALLFRSSDRGARFDGIDLSIEEGEQAPMIVGVDPTNADRLFLRMRRSELERDPERLLHSTDGGASFEPILSLLQMRGFAIADDGQTVWAGSAQGNGVWIARGGTLAFERINDLEVRCLAARGSELWMCVDQLASRFALGRSIDEGASWDVLLFLDELGELPACPTCAATSVVCPFWMDDLRMDFARYLGADAGVIATDASVPAECADAGPIARPDAGHARDAGVDGSADGGTEPAQGCGCSAVGSSGPLPLALFAAWIVCVARRR